MTDSKIKIDALSYGALRLTSDEDFGAIKTFHVNEVEALREYLQAERDKELGWWRASPEYVVKPSTGENVIGSRYVIVLNERLGITATVREGEGGRGGYGIAARAYFDAHPEQKPWMEAKPGEAWVLTADDDDAEARVYVVDADGYFDSPHGIYGRESAYITAGRRIWPAQDGDNDE